MVTYSIEEKKTRVHKLIVELLTIPSEERQEEIVEELNRISPDPYHIDYIYQTDDYVDEDGNIDVDAVVEKIFSYKPIQL